MGRRRRSTFDISLHPETRRSVGIVFVFAFAALLFLSVFDLAGVVGQEMKDGLSHVFGWDKLLLPFFFAAWGVYLTSPDRLPMRFVNVVGILLFFLSLNPLTHLASFGVVPVHETAIQLAGGKLGEAIALPFSQMVGLSGAIALLFGLLIISLLLMFNATLQEVLFVVGWIWKAVEYIGSRLFALFQAWRASRAEQERPDTVLMDDVKPSSAQAVQPPLPAQEFLKTSDEEVSDEDVQEPRSINPIDVDVVPKKKKHYPRVEIPIDLLERRDQKPTAGDIVRNKEVIRRTLETFGIPVEMSEIAVGPTVTQFSLKPANGVKLTRITSLHNDLALALAAHPIRIEAPIPGKSLVGVEVPNQSVATVGVREILESREYRERKSSISFALGKDVSGKPWVADLGKMPHLLVAGATGSGKSVCLNAIVVSFLYANGPDDLKLIMVDPKRVELQVYNGIPHLVTPVITKVPETVNALKWALREMDRRYDLLAKFGVRDLATYNQRVPQDKLPHLVIVIDELADLMITAAADVEGPIVRLAQMSRAVGIHLVLATQRPSVDVITGLIKANIPARIAFAVASATDSRTILDQQGAEKLLGRGDMLLSTAELSMPKRLQGVFVSDVEIARVVDFIKSKYEPADYDYSVVQKASGQSGTVLGGSVDDEDSDPLIPEAKEEILRAGKASASLLQRRLKVGYARAARLLDLLEQEGFIGPGDGAKPREILKAEFSRQTAPSSSMVMDQEEDDTDEDESSL